MSLCSAGNQRIGKRVSQSIMLKQTTITPMGALLLATGIVVLMRSQGVTAVSVSSSVDAAAERQSVADHRDTFDDEMTSDEGLRREPDYQFSVENDDQLAEAMTRWYLTHQQTRLSGVGGNNAVPLNADINSGAGKRRTRLRHLLLLLLLLLLL